MLNYFLAILVVSLRIASRSNYFFKCSSNFQGFVLPIHAKMEDCVSPHKKAASALMLRIVGEHVVYAKQEVRKVYYFQEL